MTSTSIEGSTRAYEAWLRKRLDGEIVEDDLRKKHEKMAEGAFAFLRATYWRWAETILDVCPELARAPAVLAVGDIHLENFGTWRDVEGRLIWGVNDFDEAAEMPCALDLVRLATSAVLGCPDLDPGDDICTPILKGYADGLAKPGAIVLDQDYGWLREMVVVPDDERADFWEDIAALKTAKTPAPNRYLDALRAALPDRDIALTVRPRSAGAGSLGRPRWVGVGKWKAGLLVREAKAIVPSGWTRLHAAGSKAHGCREIATGRHRAPDPWYSLAGDIVVRRLSPNNRKIEAAKRPEDLARRKTLRAMGHDLASVHLGRGGHAAAIKEHLSKRGAGWLRVAAERASKFVRREHKEWKQAWKKMR